MAQEFLDPRHQHIGDRTYSSSPCSPSHTSFVLIRKLLVGLLKYSVFIPAAWSRHSLAVEEKRQKEKTSRLSCLRCSWTPLPWMGTWLYLATESLMSRRVSSSELRSFINPRQKLCPKSTFRMSFPWKHFTSFHSHILFFWRWSYKPHLQASDLLVKVLPKECPQIKRGLASRILPTRWQDTVWTSQHEVPLLSSYFDRFLTQQPVFWLSRYHLSLALDLLFTNEFLHL